MRKTLFFTMILAGLVLGSISTQAQELGFAEADPTFDIEGVDAAHKITILASIAFGIPIDFDAVHIEGISNLNQKDIMYAEELGYKIKLLGFSEIINNKIYLLKVIKINISN